jgi:catechol 2,3-dioxygenase-like lactoylglutathione lyase family enzyme
MKGNPMPMIKRTLGIAACMTLMFGAAMPNRAQAQDLPGLTSASLGHVSLTCTNIDAMADFYIKKLGFAIETQGKSPEMGNKRFIYLKLNDFILELAEADKDVAHDPPLKSVAAVFSKPGFGHLGLRVGDLDVVTEELKARGVKLFYPPQTYSLVGAPYQRNAAFILDPENNAIELGEAADVQEKPDPDAGKKKKK